MHCHQSELDLRPDHLQLGDTTPETEQKFLLPLNYVRVRMTDYHEHRNITFAGTKSQANEDLEKVVNSYSCSPLSEHTYLTSGIRVSDQIIALMPPMTSS